MTLLGNTTNFSISYDEQIPNARRCAEILMLFCEQDFTQLSQWFNIFSGFGNSNRIHVQVYHFPPNSDGKEDSALGTNQGYFSGQENNSMGLNININSSGYSDNVFPGITLYLLFVFVAELSEIFMSYKDKLHGTTTWGARNSNGEALSHFCAHELHYDPNNVIINEWLALHQRNTSSHDWITNTKHTDGDVESYGLGLLFMYYLKTQLGYKIHDIILEGGFTLEQTFQNLTGRTGGFNELNRLIDFYYPIGYSPFASKNDIFPLVDPLARKVTLSYQSNVINKRDNSQSSATVSPFPHHCATKKYSYTITESEIDITVTASVSGFADPDWGNAVWYINGKVINFSGTFTDMVYAYIPTPGGVFGDTQRNFASTSLFYIKNSPSNSIRIYKYLNDMVGNFTISVDVEVNESFRPGAPPTPSPFPSRNSINAFIEQLRVVWEAQYYIDRAKCMQEYFRELEGLVKKFSPLDNILLTLPDPPHDYSTVLNKLYEFNAALEKTAMTNPKLSQKSKQYICEFLQIEPAVLDAFKAKPRVRKTNVKTVKQKIKINK